MNIEWSFNKPKEDRKRVLFQRKKLWMFIKLYLIYWKFYMNLVLLCMYFVTEICRYIGDWWSCNILVSAGLCVSLISPGDLVVHCLPSSPLPLLITMSLLTNYSASYHNIATYSTNKQLFYFKAFWNFFEKRINKNRG